MEQIKVMVAEDIALLREDFMETINAQPDMTVVGSAATGFEISRLAMEQTCDVILMDVEMERIDAGITAAIQIHKHRPKVKIVFLSVHESDELITGAMDTGAVDYVVKGCSDEALVEHIRRAYRGETVLDPQVQRTVMNEYTRLRQSERSLIFFINNVSKLTSAERELVQLLLQGRKISEMAQMRCVEEVTIKTQIKGLLRKFGCSRTKEIVEMIRTMGLEQLFL